MPKNIAIGSPASSECSSASGKIRDRWQPIGVRVRPGILLAIAIAWVLLAPATGLTQPAQPDLLAVPDTVAVTLDARTTAVLAIDFLESNCAPDPRCAASLPMAAAGLAAARDAGVPVVYATHPAPDNV